MRLLNVVILTYLCTSIVSCSGTVTDQGKAVEKIVTDYWKAKSKATAESLSFDEVAKRLLPYTYQGSTNSMGGLGGTDDPKTHVYVLTSNFSVLSMKEIHGEISHDENYNAFKADYYHVTLSNRVIGEVIDKELERAPDDALFYIDIINTIDGFKILYDDS